MCKPKAIASLCMALCLAGGCSSTKSSQPAAPAGAESLAQDYPAPLVGLNYVYLTLDAETIDSINQSLFIRDHFCRFGQSIPDPHGAGPTSSTYLLGKSTCIELTPTASHQAETEGNSGMCFSTKRTGDIDIIYENLRAKPGLDVRRGTAKFYNGSERIPWLRSVSSHSPRQTPPLLTWVTEHDPAFFKALRPESKSRRDKRKQTYSSNGPDEQNARKLFRNITSVTLALTQGEFDQFGAELLAYGYSETRQKGQTVFSGPGIEIRTEICPDPRYRIRALSCSLNGQSEAPTRMTFGDKAALTIKEDATATWTFGPGQRRFARN